MTRYRKKPVEVEAWQVGSDEAMPEWIISAREVAKESDIWLVVVGDKYRNVLQVFKGNYMISEDDFCYVVSADEFNRIYEAVNDAED